MPDRSPSLHYGNMYALEKNSYARLTKYASHIRETLSAGGLLGRLVYWVTKNGAINKFATNFALTNPFGSFIYTSLSKKSFIADSKNNDKFYL